MTSAADPTVTVVVPTYRRPEALHRALASLATQKGAPSFVVVVVDNDPHGTLRPALPSGLAGQVVHEPTPGAAAARNRGIAEAATPLLAMLDDDVVPDPGWLAALAAPVLSGVADVVGGRVVLDPCVGRPRWLSATIEGYLTALDLGPDPRALTEGETLLTASLLTTTALLRAIGGFRSELGPTAGRQLVGDDVALVRALTAHGGRPYWAPAALVIHELPAARLDPRWVVRRAWLQGRSDWRVDRSSLQDRGLRGARVAGSWLRGEAQSRRREGLHRPDVAFHLLCDVARTGGALVEAASWRERVDP